MYREYAIFDRDGVAIFDTYDTIRDAFDAIASCFDTNVCPMDVYRPLFPVTIEGLDGSDIYTTITTITYESR